MKKLVVLLVVVVLLLALSAPAFAAAGGVPAAHGVDGRDGGELISLVVRNQYVDPYDRCFFVEHVSTWKPGLDR